MTTAYASPTATPSAPAVDTSTPATYTPGLSTASTSPTNAAGLQGSAGNAAIQDQLASAGSLGAPVAQSGDPEINGRSPEDLSADLKHRIADYWAAVPDLQQIGEAQAASERSWVERRGVFGLLIDAFNPSALPDVARWDGVLGRWEGVSAELEAATAVTPEAVNTLGTLATGALRDFDATAQLQASTADAFQAYLGDFTGCAQTIASVTEVGRDIAFAAAVGVAVIGAAPFVAGAAVGAATSAGLSSGAAAAVGTGATVAAAAGIGAGIEGGGRAVAAAASEGLDALNGEEADWDRVASEAEAGAERGTVDGVLGLAGASVERAIAPTMAKSAAKIVGESGSRVATAAVAGGLTGSVSGGLTGAANGGVSAAMEGGDLGQVGDAMERGVIVGALTGTLLGAAGGAWASRPSPEALEELLRLDPDAFAQRYTEILSSMTPEERAAFDQNLQGRRFVSKGRYEAAADAYTAGETDVPPEHYWGKEAFDDWSNAAQYTDDLAADGQTMTQADLEEAHRLAAQGLATKEVKPGELRGPDAPGHRLIARGGRGQEGAFSALTPEEQAAIAENPDIDLVRAKEKTPVLTDAERAAGYASGVLVYPPGDTVVARLDDFFAWYAAAAGTMDPVAFAALAQKRLISIHPFGDGNGRVTRLVMDHALQSQGLPPALVANTRMDLMSTDAQWIEEVRAGVVETWQVAASHADAYNAAIQAGDTATAAAQWGILLGLTGGGMQTYNGQEETNHGQ